MFRSAVPGMEAKDCWWFLPPQCLRGPGHQTLSPVCLFSVMFLQGTQHQKAEVFIEPFVLPQLLGLYTGGEPVSHLVKEWQVTGWQPASVPLSHLQEWGWLILVETPAQAGFLWDLLPLVPHMTQQSHQQVNNLTNGASFYKVLSCAGSTGM